jgi:isopenicillin N synthase-like dioxygenase
MSFTSIPVLDLALARDPETKASFLEDLRHALLEVGFLYLKNVGISDEFFQQVITEGRAFFDIPTEEKYDWPHDCFSLTSEWLVAESLTGSRSK